METLSVPPASGVTSGDDALGLPTTACSLPVMETTQGRQQRLNARSTVPAKDYWGMTFAQWEAKHTRREYERDAVERLTTYVIALGRGLQEERA